MPAASSGAIKAGKTYVEILADDTGLEKGLKSAEGKLKSFGASIAKVGVAISGFGSAITGPIIGAAYTFAEAGSDLLIMSERTGLSVEELSKLSYTAKQTGTDMGEVEVAIRRMQKSLTAGSLENMLAQQTFAELGLSIQDLIRMRPDKQFETIAAAIAKIPNDTMRSGAAMMIFGRSGAALIPLAENFKRFSDEAEEFGLVTGKEAAEEAHRLHQSMNLLTSVFNKIVTIIGSAVAPRLTEWNRQLARLAKTVQDFVKNNKALIQTIYQVGLVITGVGTAIIVLGALFASMGAILGGLAATFHVLVAAMSLLLTPAGLIIAAFVGMTAAFLMFTDEGQAAVASLKTLFGDLLSTAQETFRGISAAIKAGDIKLAVQILWAGIRVEWLKGTNYVKSIQDSWSGTAKEAIENVRTKISAGLIGIWSFMRTGWTNASGFVGDIFIGVVNNIKSAWSGFLSFFSELWDKISATASKGIIDIKTNVKTIKEYVTNPFGGWFGKSRATYLASLKDQANAEKAAIDQGVADRAAARERDKADQAANAGDALVKRQLDRQVALKNIEDEKNAQLAALFDAANAEKKARQEAAAAGTKEAEDALKKAQAHLDELVGKAAIEGGKIKPIDLKEGKIAGVEGELGPEGLGAALGATKAKIDVAGGFSARALAGLGAGTSVQDEQLKEQKQTNKHLAGIEQKAALGHQVFGV